MGKVTSLQTMSTSFHDEGLKITRKKHIKKWFHFKEIYETVWHIFF